MGNNFFFVELFFDNLEQHVDVVAAFDDNDADAAAGVSAASVSVLDDDDDDSVVALFVNEFVAIGDRSNDNKVLLTFFLLFRSLETIVLLYL